MRIRRIAAVYGSPRIHAELKEQGVQRGAKTSCSPHARARNQCEIEKEKNKND